MTVGSRHIASTDSFANTDMVLYTVQESVNHASDKQPVDSGLKSAVICGNGNFTISN